MLYLQDSSGRIIMILNYNAGRKSAACIGLFSSNEFFNAANGNDLGQVRIGSSRICFKSFVFFGLLRILLRSTTTGGASGGLQVRDLRTSTRSKEMYDRIFRYLTKVARKFCGLANSAN